MKDISGSIYVNRKWNSVQIFILGLFGVFFPTRHQSTVFSTAVFGDLEVNVLIGLIPDYSFPAIFSSLFCCQHTNGEVLIWLVLAGIESMSPQSFWLK